MSVTQSKGYAFQDEAVTAVFDYLKLNNGHPLVVAPTGAGKTHILSKIIREVRKRDVKARVLVLTHVKEIINQDYKTLIQYVPKSQVGVWSAGLKRKEKRQYTIAGIQSIYKHGRHFLKYDYVIVDEAHLIPANGEGRYRTFLKEMRWSKVIGLTATPFRLGHGMITDNHLFDKIVYDIEILDLIKGDYLSPLIAKQPEYAMDVSKVKTVAGDFSKKDLSENLDNLGVTNAIVKELKQYIKLRKKWLIFAIDIEHAEHITRQLISHGIRADVVHSQQKVDRSEILKHFHRGHVQALVSVETLTTGFDAPDVDMIVMMRPTKSPVLHVQMIGRGLRTAPGKTDCLVLDFAGNIQRLGPINDVHIPGKVNKGAGKGKPMAKECPECHSLIHLSIMTCPDCGYEFPKQQKLTKVAETTAPIREKATRHTMELVKVDKVTYAVHNKPGSFPTLKVSYRSGLNVYSEWIGFQHGGYTKHKAMAWWKQRTSLPSPETTYQAKNLSNVLKKPKQIGVVRVSKYPEIVRYVF